MKFRKIFSPFLPPLYVCFILLSGCTTNQASTSASSAAQTPNVISTTQQATPTSIATSSASSSAFPTDCPEAGTVRPAQLSSNMGTVQPAVFYVTAWGGVQTGFNPLSLMRYDLTTHKTVTIYAFTGNAVEVRPSFQLSPDKHWLLITDTWRNATESITGLRLLSTDGAQLQTLACFPSGVDLSAVHWLPDGQRVALTKEQSNQTQFSSIDVLTLATGKTQTVLSGEYAPALWLDDHRLIIEKPAETNRTYYFLFDITRGSQQKISDLTSIASFPTWGNFVYGNFAVSLDGSQLFASSFAQASANNPANCRGATAQGPGTVAASTITGASRHVVYSSQSLAVLDIIPISLQTLLLYVENNTGDLSQNGLWKINTDGTGLTRLTSANDQACRDLDYWELSPQIASNNQSYALVQTDSTRGYSQSIVVGNLSGGTPTTIANDASIHARAGFDRFLQLVAMA